MKIAIGILVGLVAAAFAALASGPDANATPTAGEVYARTMSPFCPGVTLRDCGSDSAADLRREISKKVAKGATNDEIDAWLVESFGPKVLGAPKGAALWMTPLTVAAIGAAVVGFGLSRMSKVSVTDPAPLAASRSKQATSDADKARLETELQAFRRSTE